MGGARALRFAERLRLSSTYSVAGIRTPECQRHTDEMRSTVSQRVPGALIRSMRFTL